MIDVGSPYFMYMMEYDRQDKLDAAIAAMNRDFSNAEIPEYVARRYLQDVGIDNPTASDWAYIVKNL